MYKKILKTVICLSLFSLFCVQSTFALSTYVGVKILELKDDPASSCAGVSGYGDQGRIRGFVSNPDEGYPIYYKLYKFSDGTVIWEGNSTNNTDYERGDTMLLPQVVDLTPGEEYGLFFDVDAYKIYLPLRDYYDFRATLDDIYWTSGRHKDMEYEVSQLSTGNGCTFNRNALERYNGNNPYRQGITISNNRSKLNSACWSDDIDNNCDNEGMTYLGYSYSYTEAFKIGSSVYRDLYTSTKGNFEFTFIFN